MERVPEGKTKGISQTTQGGKKRRWRRTLAETVNAAPKQVDEVVGVVDEEHPLYICSDCGQPLKGTEDHVS